MNVYTYHTVGGKDLIKAYLDELQKNDRLHGYTILYRLETYGLDALNALNTRQIDGKIWEIKFSQHRLFYVLIDNNNIYLIHACHKQKNRTEGNVLETAIKRAQEILKR